MIIVTHVQETEKCMELQFVNYRFSEPRNNSV